MTTNSCLLCGVGGQGTVLASRLIALAAMEKGLHVRTAETIGMSQRGGSVVSHVRVGDEIDSPLIPAGGADVIVGFEPAEAVRCIRYLKKGGTVVVNTRPVQPVTASLSGSGYDGTAMLEYLKACGADAVFVDGDEICRSCGSPKVLNVALLAAAVKSGKLDMTAEELVGAIEKRVPEKYRAINLAAVNEILGGKTR